MAAIGIATLYSYSEPLGLFLEELDRDQVVEERTIRNKFGVTVQADTLGFVKITRVAKGRGNEDLAAVTAGAFTEGAFKVTSVKNGQTNDHYSTFEQTALMYEDLG
jgi:hypothetical protein